MAQGTQRQLWFALPNGLGSGYIDIAQSLSQVNRKGYSQNKTYYVEGYQVIPAAAWGPGVASVDIDVVGNTWTTENSHREAFRLWKKMNRQTGIDQGTWADFKVFMDRTHYLTCNNPYSTNLTPIDGAQAVFSSVGAEWEYSLYVSPTAAAGVSTVNACHMLGDDETGNNANIGPTGADGSHAIIQGYADTRTTVQDQDPLVPGDASNNWMTNLFDDGDTMSDLVNVQETDGDRPPYGHAIDAPGGDNPIYVGGSESGAGGMLQTRMRLTNAGDTGYGQGGEVLAGLLRVGFASESGNTALLCVNVAPGTYQGVAAKAV